MFYVLNYQESLLGSAPEEPVRQQADRYESSISKPRRVATIRQGGYEWALQMRRNAKERGTQRVAMQLRKQGIPLWVALAVLASV